MKQLVAFGASHGFDVVSFLEPVRRSLKAGRGAASGPAMAVLRGNRVFSLPLTHPVESWPIAAQSSESAMPFIWRPDESRYFGMNRLAQLRRVAVRSFMRRFDVKAAVTTPVHVDAQTFGFVTWFYCAQPDPPVAEWQGMLQRLQQAATEFLETLPGLMPAPAAEANFGLSQRQLECLRWAALGKTNDEIAELIGRSVETVRFHLKKSATKLNANNRIHAIAVASYLQLLGDIVDLP